MRFKGNDELSEQAYIYTLRFYYGSKVLWLMEVENLETCYFCQSKNIALTPYQRTIQYDGKKYQFARCQNCTGYSLLPRLTEKQVSRLYSSDYVGANENQHSTSDKEYEAKFTDLANYLASHRGTLGKTFLDYGCGANPASFKIARKNELMPHGMELTPDVRTIAQQNTGIKLLSREEIIHGDELFDVIFLGDVLEHLVDPISELKYLTNNLTVEGVLIAQGPLQGANTLTHGIVGLYSWLTHNRSTTYPPYHVSLATLRSMEELLTECNLKISFKIIYEVDWPVPSFAELLFDLTPRNMILFIAKQVDKIFAQLFRDYGTRYFVVCKKLNMIEAKS